MATDLMDKIERLEAQLPRWEKWLLICYGMAFTMFVNAVIRGVENAYLNEAFVFTDQEIKAMGPNFSFNNIPVSIYDAFSKSLNAPWWILFVWIFMLVMLLPGILLSIHSGWRKISLAKRFNLIFGYFISAWVVFLSIGAENPNGTPDGYIFLLVASAIAIGTGYWWLRRKKDRAEEVFP
jgi:hypothetical protein